MTKSLLPLLLVSTALTAHAGWFSFDDKKPAAPAPTAPAKAPATPAASTTTAADAGLLAEGQKLAFESASSMKAELASASKAALDQAKSLLNDPQATGAMKEQLVKLTESLAGAKDGASAEALAKIVALKPTAAQMGLVKELQSNVGVLVLGRNFDQNDPASGGAVKGAIEALKGKNTAGVLANLQKLAGETTFSDSQKQMAGNLLGSFNPKVAAAVDKAKEGYKALKGFGL